MSPSTTSDAIEVPYESLQPDTLRAVVEEFITRNGTDYGEREQTLESKIADVMRQLERGEAAVVFDPKTDSVNIVLAANPFMEPSRRLSGGGTEG